MQKFVNNYKTTLYTGINNSQLSMEVPYSTEFDDLATLSGSDYYLLTISDATHKEIVKVTAVGAGPIRTLTITRDASNTGHGSFAFAAGSKVEMNVTAEAMNTLSQAVSNVAYPPNYTVNVQTKSSAGTVNVPFTPLVIQQVNVDVASGVILNVTPGSTFGECVITLYRTNLSHAWPTLKYNGNVVPVAGDPPGSSDYNAKLLCRSEPGSGYLPNPFVTFEWITRAVAASASYQSPFGTSAVNHGITYTGNSLVINPSTTGNYHSGKFQSGTYLDVFPNPWPTVLTEFIFYSEGLSGIPTIRFMGAAVTVMGTAPTAGASWVLRGTIIDGYIGVFEWLKISTY